MNNETLEKAELMAAIYRAVLKREIDEAGRTNYLIHSSGMSVSETIEFVTASLMASDEFKIRFGQTLTTKADINWISANFTHVMSLGTNCQTSSLLKKFGLKAFSGPLDWLLSSPEMVAHCLNDRFKTLLDSQHYSPLPSGTQAQHNFYLDEYGVDSVFTHINPLETDKYEYVERCVKRFLNALDSHEKTLLVMLARPDFDLATSLNCVVEALKPWPHAHLVAIQLMEPTGSQANTSSHRVCSFGQHTLYRMQPSSQEQGVGWPDLEDETRFMKILRDGAQKAFEYKALLAN